MMRSARFDASAVASKNGLHVLRMGLFPVHGTTRDHTITAAHFQLRSSVKSAK